MRINQRSAVTSLQKDRLGEGQAIQQDLLSDWGLMTGDWRLLQRDSPRRLRRGESAQHASIDLLFFDSRLLTFLCPQAGQPLGRIGREGLLLGVRHSLSEQTEGRHDRGTGQ